MRRILALWLCVAPALVWAADPAFYIRKDTWQQTLLASRDALMKAEAASLAKLEDPASPDAKGFTPFHSGEVSSRQRSGRRVKVRLRGLEYLWLIHTAKQKGDDRLAGCWGNAVLVGKDKKKIPLHTVKPAVSRGDVQVRTPEPAGGKKKRKFNLRIGRQQLSYGIVVKPGGELCYALEGKFEWLEAVVGVVSARNRNATMAFHAAHLPRSQIMPAEENRRMLWTLVARDFPSMDATRQMGREQACRIWVSDWTPGDRLAVASRYAGQLRSSHLSNAARDLAKKGASDADVQRLADMFHGWQDSVDRITQAKTVNVKALRMAIEDLTSTFGERYPHGKDHLKRLAAIEAADLSALAASGKATAESFAKAGRLAKELTELQQVALLENPLLDFDRLLVVKRGVKGPKLGLPQNWQGNCALPRSGYDDEIAVLSPVGPGAKLTTLFKPTRKVMTSDVELHYDADRILFSSLAESGKWQVFEMGLDGKGLRQVTTGPLAEVDNYDPCYLPDGRIIFASSAVYAGVPCVGGKTPVSNLYIMDADGGSPRQLCFDQDHNWCPTVMNDGRVMYSRWEYTDTPHYFTRLLFHMNPDGTQQMELYGSNSYWPNSTFYARPIPGHRSKVVAVISGHHGVPRMGELVVFDTAVARHQADGVVQRIPGHGKPVEPLIRDGLVNSSWPKFLHPWPLSDKYFLVSMSHNRGLWGIYLVDVFDNLLLLCEVPGYALLEPVPVRRRGKPPVLADKVDLKRKDSVVYLIDVYSGDGLKGVPRGSVKQLRVLEWHYGYQRIGGHQAVGVEAGWDVKRILGTVPVEADGSALFHIPANTPVAVQPLDEKGRALQLMRSWFVGMPGEVISCVGCHEHQGAGTANYHTRASQHAPSDITPWYGPARGFGFKREVQPVLDAHCVRCHNGKPREDKRTLPNFADTGRGWSGFTNSYLALHPYVRRPGPESDYHMLAPAEYLANTSELVQMLEKGHHGVKLEAEAWDRLITWIDFNVPDHGTWTEQAGETRTTEQCKLRAKFRKLYANIDVNPEAIYPVSYKAPATPPAPEPAVAAPKAPACPGWPFDAAEAKKRQTALGPTTRSIELAEGLTLELARVPAGEFVLGDPTGNRDEWPPTRVRIDKPFWVGRTEVTNAQFRAFDPTHDSRFIDQHWKDHTLPGYPANGPKQPAIRISWRQAMAFCTWLSEKTGEKFTLPTEAQWEWACRAGTASPLFCGDLDADFSRFANLADKQLDKMAVKGVNPKPIANANPYQAFLPNDDRFDDGQMIVCDVAKYQPNPWGLLDMHGNVAEWTLSTYQPYPYRASDGRNRPAPEGRKVVRGGSWRDRPKRARSGFRIAYPSWQGVAAVGFRVVCPDSASPVAAATLR